MIKLAYFRSIAWWELTHPVDLIQVIGLQNNAADDTGSRGNLHRDIDLAEEDVEIGLNGRGITLLVDGELGAIGASLHMAGGGLPSIESRITFGEVRVKGGLVKTRVRGAGL